jgi:hypothetical protein
VCSLRSFTFNNAFNNKEEIIYLLFAMPRLETLTLGPPSDPFFPYVTEGTSNSLADTATISARLNDQPDEPFLPNLQSLGYIGPPTFSWKCVPIIFGCRTKELGGSEPQKSNQRPLLSLRIELHLSSNADQGSPEADVAAELNRLRDEEGYEIQIMYVTTY